MFNIQYHRSFSMISNQDRNRLKASRTGKSPSSCTMAPAGNKTILIGVPYEMAIPEAGSRVERLSRLFKDYTLVPVSMPRTMAA